MPRAGSTLIEQILASHSAVEGTSELPNIIAMARALRQRADDADLSGYAEVLATLDEHALRDLGERYLQGTRVYRKTARAHFIDKMPNNFLHVGLIHSILPNAKIIDARRSAMGCCFSGFKQLFAEGQEFSYDLAELGAYYRAYLATVRHFQQACPGMVHTVIYEDLVDHTEAEVRKLLAALNGLDADVIGLNELENSTGVEPLASIVALLAGGMLWGVAGLILAIPFTGVLKAVCDEVPGLKAWGFLLGEEPVSVMATASVLVDKEILVLLNSMCLLKTI